MPCPPFPVFALPPLQQIPGIGLLSECVRTETLGEMASALPVEILQAGIVALVCVQESLFVRPGRVGRSPPAEKVEDSPFGISPEHHDGLYRAFVPGIIPDGNLAGIRVHLDRYGKRLLHACLIGYFAVPLEGILMVSVPSRPGASICPLSVISRGAYSMAAGGVRKRKRGDRRKRSRSREKPIGKLPYPEEREGKKVPFLEYFLIASLFGCLLVILVKGC